MRKIIHAFITLALVSSCSTQKKEEHEFEKHARICNKVCVDNKEVREIQFKVGGGLPLVFLGGIEAKCACQLQK